MVKSIKDQLEALETLGRVSVSGRRQVHAEFGFSAMKRDDEATSAERETERDFSTELDAAHIRLKAQVPAE